MWMTYSIIFSWRPMVKFISPKAVGEVLRIISALLQTLMNQVARQTWLKNISACRGLIHLLTGRLYLFESYFMQPDIIVENVYCFNDKTKLSLSNTRYVQGVKWTIGEGAIQTTMDVQHTFSSAKTWDIEAEVDTEIKK